MGGVLRHVILPVRTPRDSCPTILVASVGLPCLDKSGASSHSSAEEVQNEPVPTANNADSEPRVPPLVLSSDEVSEICSEAEAHSLSGYDASSDAESLPADSRKYIIPARPGPGQPVALPRRLSVGDQTHSRSTLTSSSSDEGRRPRRPQRTRKKPPWMTDPNWVVG